MKNFSEFPFNRRQLVLELWKHIRRVERKCILPDSRCDMGRNLIANLVSHPQVGSQQIQQPLGLSQWRGPTFWVCFRGFWPPSHGESFFLIRMGMQFPSPHRSGLIGWAQEGMYSCPCGRAALQTVSVGKVTGWYAAKWLVLQAKMCSAPPSSGAEALKLNVTDVRGWKQAYWAYKRAQAGDKNAAYGDRMYFLSKRSL